MNRKDPSCYDVLGVGSDATDAQIKKAYRRLALQYHPDRNPGDAVAEARFKEVGAAYEVLSDPHKRAAHDRERLSGARASTPRSPTASDSGPHRAPRPQMPHVAMDFTISLPCAAFGCIEQVPIPEGGSCRRCAGVGKDYGRRHACPDCLGNGGSWHERSARCDWCQGRGRDPYFPAYSCSACSGARWVRIQYWLPCQPCSGSGAAYARCGDCGGDGQSWTWRLVRFPAGITEGRRLRLRGQGPANENGEKTDVWLIVHIS